MGDQCHRLGSRASRPKLRGYHVNLLCAVAALALSTNAVDVPAAPVDAAVAAATPAVPVQGAAEVTARAGAPVVTPPAPPAPYSVPWQLRVVAPVRALRLDNALDFYGVGNAVNVLILNAAWSFHPRMYVLARLGTTINASTTAPDATTLSNLMLGGTWLQNFGDFRFAAFLGTTLPTASGGGNHGPAPMRAANSVAMLARNSMDNALFAANDMAIVPGVDLAWVKNKFTVQLELNVNQVFRVRGEAMNPDAMKTNLTSGLHAGYFFTPQVSVGAELRYQRWLSTPAAVAKDESLRQNLNAAGGVRLHFKLSPSLMIRPGVSYSRALIAPSAVAHDVVQFDFLAVLL